MEPKQDPTPRFRLAQGTPSASGDGAAIEALITFHDRHDQDIAFDDEVIGGRAEWSEPAIDRDGCVTAGQSL